MALRSRQVRAGDWRTLESFWNVTTTAFLRAPAGAAIRIRYCGWWFAVNRQQQTLDGSTYKRLNVSRWSLFVARIQMKVKTDAVVTYDVEPGSVANMPPGISF